MRHALVQPPLRSAVLALVMLAGGIGLTACGRPADTRVATASSERSVAPAERPAVVDNAVQKARDASRDARQAMGSAGDLMADKTHDLAITSAINSRLAGDPRLSPLSITVDTVGGHVVLRGSAPDTEARGRATELARTTEGVVDVVNELNVQPTR